MTQDLFLDPERAATAKPSGDGWVDMRLLVTVKAAPAPSERYGETVCVGAIRVDLDQPGWIRLYPINFRDLEYDHRFRKYAIVRLRARPARRDPRVESWQPDLESIRTETFLPPWEKRRRIVDPYVTGSMCDVLEAVRSRYPRAPSMAAVRPRGTVDIEVKPHRGWTPEQQQRIDNYVDQFDLLGEDRTALQAPPFRGWYRYRCEHPDCGGHRQGILDWEFVALQRRLRRVGASDARIERELRQKFCDEMCAPDRDVAFYVGNQASRPQNFLVGGVYWPSR